jgi:hypothetical protein
MMICIQAASFDELAGSRLSEGRAELKYDWINRTIATDVAHGRRTAQSIAHSDTRSADADEQTSDDSA